MTSASLSSLRDLRLSDMAAAYEAILALPLDQQPDGHDMLARLIDAERQGRAHRRTQLNLRLSKLRYAATLQDVDCSPQRRPDEQPVSRPKRSGLDGAGRKRAHHRGHRLWQILSGLRAR